MRSAADLPAHAMLFLVEPSILKPGQMTSVVPCIEPFLTADEVILAMQIHRLTPTDFARATFPVDAPILVFQAAIDLDTTAMMILPSGLGRCAHGGAGDGRQAKSGGKNDFPQQHETLPECSQVPFTCRPRNHGRAALNPF
jgi:hypothetical protein